MLIPNLDSKNRAHNTRLQQLPKFTSHILVTLAGCSNQLW